MSGQQKQQKKKEASGWWVWLFGLVGVVLAGLALDSLRKEPPAGPPPPQPLQLPERAAQAPPPAPLADPLAEAVKSPSKDLMERETAMLKLAVEDNKKPPPPPLRKGDKGIAPKALSRTTTGRSAGKGVADVQLVATYQGKAVSGAPVEIDGVYRGKTPLSLTLPAGSHEIRIDHKATRVNTFATQVDGGKSVELKVDLRKPSEARGNGPSKWGKRHRH